MNIHLDDVIERIVDRRGLRIVIVVALVALTAMFVAARIASASAPSRAVGPLESPISNPISLTMDCGDGWNPNCVLAASTTSGGILRTYFYVDWRYRGPAGTYNDICTLLRLRDGSHTAMLIAVDSRHFSARIGPYRTIKCDRTAPYVNSRLYYYRGLVYMRPYAIDRLSGVNVATEQLSFDNGAVTVNGFAAIANVCSVEGLSRGWHRVAATAADNAGNSRTVRRYFYCYH